MNGSSNPSLQTLASKAHLEVCCWEQYSLREVIKADPVLRPTHKSLFREMDFTPSSLTILMNLKFLTVKIGDVPMVDVGLNEEVCEIL